VTVLARAALHLLVALVTAWLGLLQPFEPEAVPATAAPGYATPHSKYIGYAEWE
jgi:hypothetical protein